MPQHSTSSPLAAHIPSATMPHSVCLLLSCVPTACFTRHTCLPWQPHQPHLLAQLPLTASAYTAPHYTWVHLNIPWDFSCLEQLPHMPLTHGTPTHHRHDILHNLSQHLTCSISLHSLLPACAFMSYTAAASCLASTFSSHTTLTLGLTACLTPPALPATTCTSLPCTLRNHCWRAMHLTRHTHLSRTCLRGAPGSQNCTRTAAQPAQLMPVTRAAFLSPVTPP